MTITITAFERSPDGGKGLARDTRVRWALEEVGQPYEVRLVSFRAMKEPAHLALHPFGQIPTYEEGDLGLFRRGRTAGRIPRPWERAANLVVALACVIFAAIYIPQASAWQKMIQVRSNPSRHYIVCCFFDQCRSTTLVHGAR